MSYVHTFVLKAFVERKPCLVTYMYQDQISVSSCIKSWRRTVQVPEDTFSRYCIQD